LLQLGGKHDEAEALYLKAIEGHPKKPASYVNLANLFAAQDRYAESVERFRQGVALDPNSAQVHSGMGAALWRLGQDEDAKISLNRAVVLDPSDADALNNLANIDVHNGEFEAALDRYLQAKSMRHDWPEIHHNLGFLYRKMERKEDAKAEFRRAVEINPEYAMALCKLGEIEAEDGEWDEAEEHLVAAEKLTDFDSETEFYFGAMYHQKKNYPEAIKCFQRSVELNDAIPEVWNNLGNAQLENGDLDDALDSFARSLDLKPDCARVHNNLGKLQRSRGDRKLAEFHYRKALEIEPELLVAASNLGALLVEGGNFQEGKDFLEQALEIQPSHMLYNGLGLLFQAQNNQDKALEAFQDGLEMEPENPEVLNNIAITYQSMGKNEKAATYFNKVLDVNPNQSEAYLNLGNLLLVLNRFDEAVTIYRMALTVNPKNYAIPPYLVHALMHQCKWDNLQGVVEQVINNTEKEIALDRPISATPFGLLSMPTTVDLRSRVTKHVARKVEKYVAPSRKANPLTYAPRAKGEKLKVGFVSPDLRNHSVAFLFNGIVKNFDHENFEYHGYMIGNTARDELTNFFRDELDFFTDFQDTTLDDATKKINDDGIHVLVDLAGHTRGSWLHLLGMRPAPVQASTIGYASSLGGNLVDYLITDDTLWPEDEQKYCSEKMAYMPHTSMPGSPRDMAKKVFTREEVGLPEEGVVFANFNGHYKFDSETFGVWMRILKQIHGSVLWIMSGSKTSRDNLKREAEHRGVSSDRIIFANNIMAPFHISRLRLADVALDCFFHVGGATTLDALWAGVPMVVIEGTNVSNRTGRNLLEVVGMHELVGCNMTDYERIAVELATDPEKLAATRAKLREQVKTSPLFDIKLFTRHMERAFEMMWENYEAGNSPKNFRVPDLSQSDNQEAVA
jgi:predicted O-linked N-acetylglucosamine transferase (SPINDLY family)